MFVASNEQVRYLAGLDRMKENQKFIIDFVMMCLHQNNQPFKLACHLCSLRSVCEVEFFFFLCLSVS